MNGKDYPIVIVYGQPLPMPRPRVNKWGGVFSGGKEIRAYKKMVAGEAQAVWAGKGLPLKGAVGIRLQFSREKQTRADLDNLVKTVQDALLGIAYLDDHQIVELLARKMHGAKRPRVEITLYDLEAV